MNDYYYKWCLLQFHTFDYSNGHLKRHLQDFHIIFFQILQVLYEIVHSHLFLSDQLATQCQFHHLSSEDIASLNF
ncbi:hypothetical protein D3C80_1144450 [compost metagenome]